MTLLHSRLRISLLTLSLISFFGLNAYSAQCLKDRESTAEFTNAKRELPACDFNQKGKNLSFCSLHGGPSMRGKDLRNYNFTGSYIDGVDFSGANLKGADFSGAYGHAVNFRGANIKRAKFNRALLTSANFRNVENAYESSFLGADLTDSVFSGNFKRARFSGADLGNASFQGANLEKARFMGFERKWVVGNDVRFAGANLEGADLTGFWACYSSKSIAEEAWNRAKYDRHTKLPPHTYDSNGQKHAFTNKSNRNHGFTQVMSYED